MAFKQQSIGGLFGESSEPTGTAAKKQKLEAELEAAKRLGLTQRGGFGRLALKLNTQRIEEGLQEVSRLEAEHKAGREARRRAARAGGRTSTILAGIGSPPAAHFLSRPSILAGG